MNKNLKFFGTDGIRGKYGGKIINNSFAYSLGKAVASHYQKNGHINKPILLARDTRPSGLELMQYLISGISEYRHGSYKCWCDSNTCTRLLSLNH